MSKLVANALINSEDVLQAAKRLGLATTKLNRERAELRDLLELSELETVPLVVIYARAVVVKYEAFVTAKRLLGRVRNKKRLPPTPVHALLEVYERGFDR